MHPWSTFAPLNWCYSRAPGHQIPAYIVMRFMTLFTEVQQHCCAPVGTCKATRKTSPSVIIIIIVFSTRALYNDTWGSTPKFSKEIHRWLYQMSIEWLAWGPNEQLSCGPVRALLPLVHSVLTATTSRVNDKQIFCMV